METVFLDKMLIDAADKSFEGLHDEAEKILLDAAGEFPGSYLVHYNLGVLYVETGKPEKAIASLEQAEKLKENNCDILNEKALAYQMTGNIKKALEYYEKALLCSSSGHDRALIQNNLGAIYFSMNSFVKAKEFFNKALTDDAGLEEARQNLLLVNTYLGIIG
ncbi:MAG: tetratricopeptide repeat protein [Spirochaetales bacterium]|nr:tetratricopeptide repeat protein [Spirochaetales bacterium]